MTTERTVYPGVGDHEKAWVIGSPERQRAIPWCTTHRSVMQQTICESYDLVSRRIGRNPLAGRSKCVEGVAWEVLDAAE